jgi:hypothetical protein
LGDRKRAQLFLFPPGFFVVAGVKLAMVQVAQGNGEFIADPAA